LHLDYNLFVWGGGLGEAEIRALTTRMAQERLQTAGLKRTRGRVAILAVLLRCRRPLTPQEIYDRMNMEFDRVSIYRSLHTFSQAGLVHRVEAGDRLWRFAVCKHERHRVHCHPHFTCRSCGTVECLTGVALPPLDNLSPGYRIEEQEVYVRGLCANCSKTQ